MNAIGCCGLQLYNFGETVSLVLWTDDWQPDSYFEKIEMNLRNGHHTLCLLDIKVKEQTIENMMKYESECFYCCIFLIYVFAVWLCKRCVCVNQ
jgi:diphthamide biosynthesis methyltransferase